MRALAKGRKERSRRRRRLSSSERSSEQRESAGGRGRLAHPKGRQRSSPGVMEGRWREERGGRIIPKHSSVASSVFRPSCLLDMKRAKVTCPSATTVGPIAYRAPRLSVHCIREREKFTNGRRRKTMSPSIHVVVVVGGGGVATSSVCRRRRFLARC